MGDFSPFREWQFYIPIAGILLIATAFALAVIYS